MERQGKGAGVQGRFTLRELVERPMGTVECSGIIISDPSRVAEFSSLVSDYSARVRSRAAWTIGYAAAKGVDISAAVTALQSGLDDRERDVSLACAYALSVHHLNGHPGSRPPLAGHGSEAVRIGANIAISDSGREF